MSKNKKRGSQQAQRQPLPLPFPFGHVRALPFMEPKHRDLPQSPGHGPHSWSQHLEERGPSSPSPAPGE